MKEIRTTVKLPPELKKKAKIAAIGMGKTFKEFYIDALAEKIEKESK